MRRDARVESTRARQIASRKRERRLAISAVALATVVAILSMTTYALREAATRQVDAWLPAAQER